MDLFGETPAKPAELKKRDRRRLAQSRLERAMAEIPIALREVTRTREIEQPFAATFARATAELEAAYARHHQEGSLTKAQLFDAYDRRMEAGYRWHPYREAARHALGWLKALQKEADDATFELGS